MNDYMHAMVGHQVINAMHQISSNRHVINAMHQGIFSAWTKSAIRVTNLQKNPVKNNADSMS